MQLSATTTLDETIAAVASAAGPAARGILRISGAETVSLLQRFLQNAQPVPQFHPRRSQRYEFQIPLNHGPANFPLAVLLWPGNKSYTGQPAAEIHLVGSPPILEMLLSRLYQAGARPARPGEFTLRSFLSGRISLVQAEAVLGVIDAQSDQQLDQALSQLAGGISQRMRLMRDLLLDDLADLEAGLDFVEEDIEFIDRREFHERLIRLNQEMEVLRAAAETRMVNSSAFRVVLAGLPNAGKSSLFNRLTGRQAIVSEIEGTTTDYLTGPLTGVTTEILLYDTAGWEAGEEAIGLAAQKFRAEEYQRADLILWCQPVDLRAAEQVRSDALSQQLLTGSVPCWVLRTKADRLAAETDTAGETETTLPSEMAVPCFAVSATTGAGLPPLIAQLEEFLRNQNRRPAELLGSTAARCRDALHRTCEHLSAACALAAGTAGDEFLAEELRAAIQELGVILGHVYTDDLLDRVFSKFCIGK